MRFVETDLGRYFVTENLGGYPGLVIAGDVVVEDTGDPRLNEAIAVELLRERAALRDREHHRTDAASSLDRR